MQWQLFCNSTISYYTHLLTVWYAISDSISSLFRQILGLEYTIVKPPLHNVGVGISLIPRSYAHDQICHTRGDNLYTSRDGFYPPPCTKRLTPHEVQKQFVRGKLYLVFVMYPGTRIKISFPKFVTPRYRESENGATKNKLQVSRKSRPNQVYFGPKKNCHAF